MGYHGKTRPTGTVVDVERCASLIPLLFAGLVLAVAVADMASSSAAGQTKSDICSFPQVDRFSPWRGTASCAAIACHGSHGNSGKPGCEYVTWVTRDRHLQAFQVLLSPRSRQIVKNYRGLTDVHKALPERDRECLVCHSMDADLALGGVSLATDDGIGCERCHGPARDWLADHFRLEWKHLSVTEKAARGFRDTKGLAARTRLCTECHVGKPGQQVNHDLIAAGHPRLLFEMAAFQAVLPPHWNVAGEKNSDPGFEAKLWSMGQIVAAQAALELLSHRAGAGSKPWPEFAEYDCAACHHQLRPQSERGENPRRPLGAMPSNHWFTSQLPTALATQGIALELRIDDLYQALRQPMPRRNQIADRATAVARQLGQLPQPPTETAFAAHSLRQIIARIIDKEAATDWDDAVQKYLALAALHQATSDVDPAFRSDAFVGAMAELKKQLIYPLGWDSPGQFNLSGFEQLLRQLPRDNRK